MKQKDLESGEMSVCLGFESSKHTVWIGSFGRIWYLLKYIPMFFFSIRIEPENINSCYASIIGIIIIQIKKIYMCPIRSRHLQ